MASDPVRILANAPAIDGSPTGSATSLWQAITLAAALGAVVLLGAIVWKVIALAWPAISDYGLGFITSRHLGSGQDGQFGALSFIYGTAITSLIALLIATPLAIAIALWLSELAPGGVRGIVGSLVEMLAAIPSVVLGLWGILVLGPYLAHHVEPWLHDNLGFLPIFGAPSATGTGMFTAALILTIMIVPIIASICRELFLQVPNELEEGALALGATRWEMVRGVILPGDPDRDRRGDHSRPRVARSARRSQSRRSSAAARTSPRTSSGRATRSRARSPASYQGAATRLEASSLLYLAAILLVIGLVTNLVAQVIVRRFDPLRGRALMANLASEFSLRPGGGFGVAGSSTGSWRPSDWGRRPARRRRARARGRVRCGTGVRRR